MLNVGCSTGHELGDRPEDDRGCLQFSPETDFIGINWGNDPNMGRAAALHVYKSNNCYGLYHIVKAPDYNDKKGTNACVNQQKYGGGWHSVQFVGPVVRFVGTE